MKKEKLSFFKKLKISILDFDGYQDLAAEHISKTIVYIVLLMLIFSIVISVGYTYKFTETINKLKDYVTNEISEITYENYELTIIAKNNEDITQIETDGLIPVKIIINTQTENKEKIQSSIDDIKKEKNGILILKDRIIIKNEFSTNLIESSYKDISENYNINKIDKNEIANMLSGQETKTFIAMFFISIVIYMFIIYISSILIDILLLTILAYIVTRIARLRLKYSAIYNIATYSLSLPILLNMIYILVNIFTGFTIKYFQIMYTTIASIYIITAILIIKSDFIKKQLELNKIIEEQEKVKQEIKDGEENRKREEQKRGEQDNDEQDKEKNGDVKQEPEGDNA